MLLSGVRQVFFQLNNSRTHLGALLFEISFRRINKIINLPIIFPMLGVFHCVQYLFFKVVAVGLNARNLVVHLSDRLFKVVDLQTAYNVQLIINIVKTRDEKHLC